LAKKTLKEQQQQLIDGYKIGHARRSIWYRIISVLSAITVFCTTYAMILPALTQEDPTVGVKLAREFYYENESVSILFTVTGRAVFKDEHIQIDDPQAELVELEVLELAEGDYVYEQFSAHLEESIGAEDLAQMFALELKFSYLGNELDTKRCDITAQIKAKEEFFSDEIGDVPQNTEPEADHPMAEPSFKSDPAMALTAIQGTGTNVFDAPTVYTTDVQNVSTLTVDVKGSYLAAATSTTRNPTYTVQYYANITTIDNTISASNATSAGYKGIDVINTAGKVAPGSAPIINYYLKPLTSVAGKDYEFVTKTDTVKIYNSVEGLHYAGASNYPFLDRISSSSNSYKLTEIWKLKPDAQADSVNREDWVIYEVNANLSENFTNDSSAANSSKILIEDNDVIRMVYGPVSSTVNQDLTMYDYDVSDGRYHTTASVATGASSYYITKQVNNSNAYMSTAGDVKNYFGTNYRGINSVTDSAGTFRFAFGANKIGTGLESQIWNGLNLNTSGTTNKGVFGLTTGLVSNRGDYTPTFSTNLIIPELFNNINDHNRAKFEAASSKNYFNYLVAYYDGSNNSGALSDTAAGNYSFTQNHNIEASEWKDIKGTNGTFKVVKDANNYFTEAAYRMSGGQKVTLPNIFKSTLSSNEFTLEIEFGDIRDTGSTTVLFSDESLEQFCLYIENGKLHLKINGTDVLADTTKGQVASNNNGYDLLSYSTITITYVLNASSITTDSKQLRVYCNGAEIYKNTSYSVDISVTNNLFIGSYNTSDTYKHTTEYRSIKLHNVRLAGSNVKRNARYDGAMSLNLDSIAAGDMFQDTGGKKVIGGRDIMFKRVGDTYTLSAINNTMGGTSSLASLTNLEYFNSYSNNTILSNDFWPMDYSGTFGGDGHDIKFGSSQYQNYRKYFNSTTNGNLPVSIDGADHNSYFGFKHKFDFTVDADYCGPINFFFYGDDDVWVFLEDEAGNSQLVCDLGGVHNPVGEFVNLRDYIPEGTEGNYSLYMFYLERGGSQSTAYMRMTVPMDKVTLPTAAETDVEVEEPDVPPEISVIETQLEITNTVNNIDAPQPFLYLIKLFDEEGNALKGVYNYERFTSLSGVEKDITDTVSFETQGEDGIAFEIPHEHRLVFYDLPAGTQYLITQTTRNGFYTSYTLNDNEVIKGNVDKRGNVTDEDTVLSGVLEDNKILEVDFYNTNYAELPSTGFDGENSVFMYYVPFGIATVYMCAMPFINRTKKPKKGDELEQA